jgi:hypothetical protein
MVNILKLALMLSGLAMGIPQKQRYFGWAPTLRRIIMRMNLSICGRQSVKG